MKRMIPMALLVAIILTPLPTQAANQRPENIRQTSRWHECRFANYTGGPGWSRADMEAVVLCAVAHFGPVPGGVAAVKHVIDCESGWGRRAVSPNGAYRGLMQLGRDEFANNLRPKSWHLKPNVFNPRSNIIAGVRLASRGWGPWASACRP